MTPSSAPRGLREQKMAESLVREYFEHGDTAEVDGALTDNWRSINMHLRYLVSAAADGARRVAQSDSGRSTFA